MFVLVLLVLLGQQVIAFESLPNLPNVRGNSFKLSAKVSAEMIGGNEARLQFEEFYSRRQQRAKIRYKLLRGIDKLIKAHEVPPEGTFHLNKAHGILLTGQDENDETTCAPSSEQLIARLARTDQFDCAIQENSPQDKDELPILGPASVLLLLQKYKSRLKKINEFGLKVRNVDAVMFVYVPDDAELVQNNNNDKSIKFYCLYAKSHLANQEAIPLRIAINRQDGLHVEYELLQFQLMASESHDALETIHGTSDDILFDPLALEHAIGCAANQELIKKGAIELNNPFHGFHERRFSFKAQVFRSTGPKERGHMLANTMAVAYEGSLDMLRVDEQAVGHHSTNLLLLNLNLGHLHQAREQRDELDGEDSPLVKMLDSQGPESEQATASSCILVQVAPRAEVQPALAYDLDQLLLGVPANKFLYLGTARVRGIWTRAFEAHDTDWPIWLEQRIQMARNWATDKQVNPENNRGNAQVVLSTVIYLTQSENEPASLEKTAQPAGRLLLMEISHLRAGTLEQLRKTTIELYDFNWSLGAHTPDGSRLEEYFTLGDRCLASTLAESNHYAQVSLLLESSQQAGGSSEQLLQLSAGQRNLALLESFQTYLKLAPTLIYDMDSKIKRGSPNDDKSASSAPQTTITLATTFRLARHLQKVAQLRFYGTGRPKKLFQFKLLQYHANSLSDCFLMAAHGKRDTFFAYSANRNEGPSCLIDHTSDPEVGVSGKTTDVIKPKRFDVFTNGPMEIYFVHQFEDTKLIRQDPIRNLEQKSARAYESSQMMRKFALTLDSLPSEPRSPTSRVEFYVKNFELRELDEKHPFRVDDAQLSDTNKHAGLALIPGDEPNTLVRPTDQFGEMTFATCQSACLVDFSCQSFSICLTGINFQCVLSKVNLREPDILLKLLDIRASRDTKPGQIVEILSNQNNSTKLRVKRQAGCELHAKIYLDLFQEPNKRGIGFHTSGARATPLVRQVGGRDDCGRACHQQTYKLLHDDLATNLKLKLDELLQGDETVTNNQEENTALSEHQARLKSLCKEFLYLDGSKFVSLSSDLQSLIKSAAATTTALHTNSLDEDSPDASNNYCIIGERKLEPDEQAKLSAFNEFKQLSFERFRFKFELLFERHYGVQLSKSRMTKEETLAYAEVKFLKTFKRKSSMELMRNYLERRENIQDYVRLSHYDESQCAQMCVQQMRGLWPACKSFDMVLVSTGDQVSATCRLNTMTMHDAIKYHRGDLLDYNTALKNVQVWHFEPKLGAVEQELNLASQLETLEANVPCSQFSSRLNMALECGIFLVALTLGLMLGLTQGTKVLAVAVANPGGGPTSEEYETRDTGSLVENNDTTINLKTMNVA